MSWINISATLAIAISLLVFVQGVSILYKLQKEENTPVQVGVQEGEKTEIAVADQEGDQERDNKAATGAASRKAKKAEKAEEKKQKTSNIIGWLTILMAALGVMINLLFLTTDITISPEFGVVIVQGIWTKRFFELCLLGLVICIAMGWNLARLREGENASKQPYVWGFIVWSISIVFLTPRINTPELNEAQLYLYNILWPPFLVLWLTIGFTDMTLSLLLIQNNRTIRQQVAVTASIVVSMAAYAKSSPTFANELVTAFGKILLIIVIGLVSIVIMGKWNELGKWLSEHKKNRSKLKRHLKKFDKKRNMTLFFLGVVVFGVVVLIFSPSLVGPAPGIIIIMVGWGGITEIITDGLFHVWYSKRREWYRSISEKSPERMERVKSAGGKLAGIFKIPTGVAAFVKLFFIVVLLILLNETLNYRKTIIQPFHVIGIEDPQTLVNSADDLLINDLSLLNQQLQPILVFPTSSGVQQKRIDYVQAGDVSTTIDAALNSSVNFELGGVSVPANVLVAPVQGLVRPWLKVRVVQGSIIPSQGQYMMLVNASDGRTWKSQPTDVQGLDQAIPEMVNEIAFLMLSSEDTLRAYGLTNNWHAFQSYQQGMHHLQSYDEKHDYDELQLAIQALKDATVRDPNFALAYYRLGLALQQYRQPLQAENALRKGLSLNPDSVPLKNALAYHLYFYDSYTPIYPAIIAPPDRLSERILGDKKNQATSLWYQIVYLPDFDVLSADRASAYLGLCNAAMESDDKNSDYIAYFYCFKSHALLERLPHDQQSRDNIRQAVASTLNNLGKIVFEKDATHTKTIKGWVCLGRDFLKAKNDFVYYPPYARAALRYYQKALAVQPQDSSIQCNAAIAAKLLDQDKRMNDLEKSAQAHYVLGLKYLDQARKALRKDPAAPSPYFREAFKEYQRAININPSYHEALNAYAYTYWVFRLHWPNRKLYTLGLPELDNLAEYYAEKALRLPKMEQNDYWQVIYSRTDAEVFIANGKFRKARNILIGLEQPVNTVPGSYMLDDLRWDLAQASYCLAVQDKEQKDALEADAKNQLSLIRANEEGLETYIFNYNYSPDQLIINYRLPCGELTRQFGNSR